MFLLHQEIDPVFNHVGNGRESGRGSGREKREAERKERNRKLIKINPNPFSSRSLGSEGEALNKVDKMDEIDEI